MGTFHKRGWARRALILVTMVIGAFAFAGNALAWEDDYHPPKSDCGGTKPACDPYSGGAPTKIPARYLIQRQTTYTAQYIPLTVINPCFLSDGPINFLGLLENWATVELYSDGDTFIVNHGRYSHANGRATQRDFIVVTNGAWYNVFSDNFQKEFDDAGSPAESKSIDVVFKLNRRCDVAGESDLLGPGDDFFQDFHLRYKVDKFGIVTVDSVNSSMRCK